MRASDVQREIDRMAMSRTANEALERMAENARELGLDYEPDDGALTKDQIDQIRGEPVAWAKFSAKGNIIDLLSEPDDDYTPLYTTPPQRAWVGLTDEELSQIEGTHIGRSFAKAIEAKLKELNR